MIQAATQEHISNPLTPRHYQLTAIEYATTYRTKLNPQDLVPSCARSIISDAPGAGKTLISELAATALVDNPSHSICVICPAHLVNQWFNDISNQFPNDPIISIEGTQSKRQKYVDLHARWYIISTQSLRSKHYYELMVDIYTKHHVDCTIIDESHYVKNPSAKQSQNVRKLTEPGFCKHAILLSATPIMREADDLWHQLRIVDPITFRSHEYFLNTYCWFTWTSWGATNVTLRKGAAQALQPTLLSTSKHSDCTTINHYNNITGWMLGRTYAEIGLELPRLIAPEPILLNLTPPRRKMYDDIKLTWSTMLQDSSNERFTANSAMEVMHTLRRVINSPEKQELLTTYLDDDQGPFFIVCDYKWSCRDVANQILSVHKDKYNVKIITGEIPADERIQIAKDHAQQPNDIIIATMGSIPEGADLSSCSTVYFYEQATTPGRMHQVLSRVRRHRNTNTSDSHAVIITEDRRLILPDIDANERPVLVRYFHARRTLDQRIHEVCFLRAVNVKDLIKVELGL